jgi:anti-anti-sigma factor
MNESGSVRIIRLSGELEIGRKREIHDALTLTADGVPILLDFSEVTYADSIALTELLRFCAGAERDRVPVALVIRTPQFARIVEYAGLANAFEIFEDSAPALRYLTSA